jgi:hypothetical protein
METKIAKNLVKFILFLLDYTISKDIFSGFIAILFKSEIVIG